MTNRVKDLQEQVDEVTISEQEYQHTVDKVKAMLSSLPELEMAIVLDLVHAYFTEVDKKH